ncbi:hypothetical protein NDU88_000433 [Pleurodeles waltl]|uniref:Uncharacterized protein n=1 Tax=Pleurodeles waltl TaxID=8319 RepID=A0AAV7Q705_PLEWA|nr:hypothetical protein NDU88_000433 [Pleurodeles waltl]
MDSCPWLGSGSARAWTLVLGSGLARLVHGRLSLARLAHGVLEPSPWLGLLPVPPAGSASAREPVPALPPSPAAPSDLQAAQALGSAESISHLRASRSGSDGPRRG